MYFAVSILLETTNTTLLESKTPTTFQWKEIYEDQGQLAGGKFREDGSGRY